MAIIKKPMLAATIEDVSTLTYPVMVSPKLDGIRCLKLDGVAVTRNLKPIPNKYIREYLSKHLPEGADGEIIIGKTFQECSSGVMSHEGEPDFEYYMFDYVKVRLDKPYQDRLGDMYKWFSGGKWPEKIKLVPILTVDSKEDLLKVEDIFLKQNFEGLMARDPNGPYKCGRSTLKSGTLLKLKRWQDSEASIIYFEEKMHNQNEPEINALGHTERSTHKEGMVPAGTLGTVVAKDIYHGWEIRVGSGLNDALRKEIWDNREKYLGKIFKYKYQAPGMKDLPRFPIFEGFRDKADMDE